MSVFFALLLRLGRRARCGHPSIGACGVTCLTYSTGPALACCTLTAQTGSGPTPSPKRPPGTSSHSSHSQTCISMSKLTKAHHIIARHVIPLWQLLLLQQLQLLLLFLLLLLLSRYVCYRVNIAVIRIRNRKMKKRS